MQKKIVEEKKSLHFPVEFIWLAREMFAAEVMLHTAHCDVCWWQWSWTPVPSVTSLIVTWECWTDIKLYCRQEKTETMNKMIAQRNTAHFVRNGIKICCKSVAGQIFFFSPLFFYKGALWMLHLYAISTVFRQREEVHSRLTNTS